MLHTPVASCFTGHSIGHREEDRRYHGPKDAPNFALVGRMRYQRDPNGHNNDIYALYGL